MGWWAGVCLFATVGLAQDGPALRREQAAAVVKDRKPKLQTNAAPNEIIGRKRVYRGVLVQWAKTDKPLQLFNPFAPARYGRGDQNLTRDPFTGKAQGFTLFSVDF
jgi:hypothetical protein